MKSANDAWNMCINRYQCIINGWLFRANLVKGDNSGRYNIINNKRELLPALHYIVDFIFLSFGIMGFIVEL